MGVFLCMYAIDDYLHKLENYAKMLTLIFAIFIVAIVDFLKVKLIYHNKNMVQP